MPAKRTLIIIAALCGSSSTAQPPAETPRAELERMVGTVRAVMMKPGPVVPGWNAGGADPVTALEAAGADTHFLLIEEGKDRLVEIRTNRKIADFAPAAWRPIDSYGEAIAYAERPFVGFTPVGSRFVIGSRAHGWRENGIDCSRGLTHAILYERPDVPKDGVEAEEMIGLFRVTMLAMEGQTICERAVGSAAAGWRTTALLPDGRELPALNEDETRLTIVPAAPIADLVRGAPLEPPATTGKTRN